MSAIFGRFWMKSIPVSKLYFYYSKMISEKFHDDWFKKNNFFSPAENNSGYKGLRYLQLLDLLWQQSRQDCWSQQYCIPQQSWSLRGLFPTRLASGALVCNRRPSPCESFPSLPWSWEKYKNFNRFCYSSAINIIFSIVLLNQLVWSQS